LGDLDIDFDLDTTLVKNYRRWLDIDRAVAGVEFAVGGNKFVRELFSSAVDGVIVMRIRSEKSGSVAFTANLSRKASASTVYESSNTLVMQGNTDTRDRKGNCEYEVRVSVKTKNGSVSNSGDTLVVRNADEAVVLIACATSYVLDYDQNYRTAVPRDSMAARIRNALAKPYEKMKQNHMADYFQYFDRMHINLGQKQPGPISTPPDGYWP
jgi:alpha-L-fucosidase 2